jgi:hypothetical protein
MTDLRAYALETVMYALQLAMPRHTDAHTDAHQVREHAEALIAIAEENEVRVESLLAWIHTSVPGKEWSLAEWRNWCALYRDESEHRQQ